MKDLEENKVQRELMSEEEFKEYIHNRIMPLHLATYEAVRKCKSVRRAIRRGCVMKKSIKVINRLELDMKTKNGKMISLEIYSRNIFEIKKGPYKLAFVKTGKPTY